MENRMSIYETYKEAKKQYKEYRGFLRTAILAFADLIPEGTIIPMGALAETTELPLNTLIYLIHSWPISYFTSQKRKEKSIYVKVNPETQEIYYDKKRTITNKCTVYIRNGNRVKQAYPEIAEQVAQSWIKTLDLKK